MCARCGSHPQARDPWGWAFTLFLGAILLLGPVDLYRFDVLAHFNSTWQPEKVLRATHDGRSRRAPGITRDPGGQPAFFLREERRL